MRIGVKNKRRRRSMRRIGGVLQHHGRGDACRLRRRGYSCVALRPIDNLCLKCHDAAGHREKRDHQANCRTRGEMQPKEHSAQCHRLRRSGWETKRISSSHRRIIAKLGSPDMARRGSLGLYFQQSSASGCRSQGLLRRFAKKTAAEVLLRNPNIGHVWSYIKQRTITSS
jgi:hypothetical protein